ncbi:response regulator transcription factor [Umezawaea tangerina]|uniref:Two-component system OmpR family response regulator n=1 Tax=Umezawaea tangerina TaxID=84725 RepID=A0A2T0SJW2_9PSEU|nr:response regulator transcription factor [Umezawaea tangerina]PRY33698.1 two-component system OmpR family response regulator [Umezawaea tangerina]
MASLLVVEDDPTLRELLGASLRFAGFEVVTAVDGAAALGLAEREAPGLVVLDVMLPDIGGFEVLRRLRRAHGEDLPVVFLTARDTHEDKVDGLSVGGDDYVTKPFRLEELIARIHAVLRRAGRSAGVPNGTPLAVGDLELDPNAHLVTRGGERVELSQTEFKLLRYLMEHADQTVAKSRIVRDVWNHDFGGDPSIVESYVSYLRRKVERGEPKLIHTVRGIGYVLRTPRP